jgi:histidinol-phosphate aminotransferase
MTNATAPIPQPGILDIAPYVAGKSKTASGKPPIKLSSNENPLGCSPKALEAYARATTLHRYPDSAHTALREAIGAAHNLPANQLICGAGSDELIHMLTQAYVGEGDEVLMSRHGFLMYPISAKSVGATVVMADERDLRADVDALLAKVTAKTKILFLANPNNPTGTYLSAVEVARLHAGLPKSCILAIDGAYAEYAAADDYTDGRELVAAHSNVIMLRTFSKVYGLPALRLGWAYAPEAMIDVLNRIRGPFNLSTPAIEAGIAAVQDQTFVQASIAHNAQWREWLSQTLGQMGLKVYPSLGNFILVQFPAGSAHTPAGANVFLTEQNIIIREVANYGLPDCLRITIGTEAENHAVADALQRYLGAQ